ncbi:copper resistance CopC family protein [Prauserella halophila]|nr:copper resistance CopC family protein [Prauserella halophila]
MATPAAAHNQLIESDPADGASLDEAPEQVTLTFNQPVQQGAGEDVNQIAVTGPDGGRWTAGDVQVDGTTVTAPLHPLGPAGEYVIGFRVLSADGHPVSEELRFTLTGPGPGDDTPPGAESAKPSAPAADDARSGGDDDSGGIPVWVWIVAAVVLLGAGVTVALRTGSDRS